MINLKRQLLVVVSLLLLIPSKLYAVDIIKLPRPQSTKDIRFNHKNEILRTALELTVNEFGPFEIRFDGPVMKRERALVAMKTGELVNVYFSPPKALWMDETIVIRVPIRRGLLNYRLLLINSLDLETFSKVNTIDDLKKLKAGVQYGWSTTDALEENDFSLVKAYNYDGLFYMLESHRFNYLPRGAHEIFDELEAREKEIKNVIVEPTIAVYLPAPTYTYVSPSEPRLAKRLEKGMELMVQNGDMKALFDKYYLDDLKKAKLHERKILKIENPFPKEKEIWKRDELWFSLEEGK